MSFSNFIENHILDWLLNAGSYTPDPAGLYYLALWIGTPGEDGSLGSEVSNANGYVREAVTSFTWDAAVGGIIVNGVPIAFPEATPSGWGNVTHFALFDSGTWGAGNMLMYGPLQGAPITIASGSIPRFGVGAIAIQLD